jgi:hypothetical protein
MDKRMDKLTPDKCFQRAEPGSVRTIQIASNAELTGQQVSDPPAWILRECPIRDCGDVVVLALGRPSCRIASPMSWAATTQIGSYESPNLSACYCTQTPVPARPQSWTPEEI